MCKFYFLFKDLNSPKMSKVKLHLRDKFQNNNNATLELSSVLL